MIWEGSPMVVACPECWAQNKVVMFGLDKRRFHAFACNRATLTCSECGYTKPYNYRDGPDGVENQWIMMHYPSNLARVEFMDLVREPTYRTLDSGEIIFGDNEHTKMLKRPFHETVLANDA